MANGNGNGGLSGVQTTAMASGGAAGGLIFAEWLTHLSWPPPEPVMAIAVAAATPLLHKLGVMLNAKMEAWVNKGRPQPPPPPVVAPVNPQP